MPVHHFAVKHRGGEIAEAVRLVPGRQCERGDLRVNQERVLAHLFEHLAQLRIAAAREQIGKARPRLAPPPAFGRSLDARVVNEPASLRQETVYGLLCTGCHEAIIIGGGTEVHCDLNDALAKDLEKLLTELK